jgi:mitogen-activated protein kinase 1/3
VCAIKKIRNFSRSLESARRILREIDILNYFQFCPQIIEVEEIFLPPSGEKDVYIVMRYQPNDLSTVVKNAAVKIDENTVRYIAAQLLLAARALHHFGCIHRDLSSRNLLVNESSQISVCDFGLSRFFDPAEQLSFGVVTQWYRAPEVILDAKYDEKVDIWSIGVVVGELLRRQHLFPGKFNDAADQLSKTFALVGTPALDLFEAGGPFESASDNAKRYATAYILKRKVSNKVATELKGCSQESCEFVNRLLAFNPRERPSADELLKDPASWMRQNSEVDAFIRQELLAQDESFHAEGGPRQMVPDSWIKNASLEELTEKIEEIVRQSSSRVAS